MLECIYIEKNINKKYYSCYFPDFVEVDKKMSQETSFTKSTKKSLFKLNYI